MGYKSTLVPNIDSTLTVALSTPKYNIVDSIRVCNTTSQDIFINFHIIGERLTDSGLQLIPINIEKKYLLNKYESAELIPKSTITMQTGDKMYAQSDYAGNTFDCIISHRQLLEEA